MPSLFARRRDLFLRAALAGCTFEQRDSLKRPSWRGKWFVTIPHFRLGLEGYVNGPYQRRHEAVTYAMKKMELL